MSTKNNIAIRITEKATYVHITVDPLTIQPQVYYDSHPSVPEKEGYITVTCGAYTLFIDSVGDQAVIDARSVAGAFLAAADRLARAIDLGKAHTEGRQARPACGYDTHIAKAKAGETVCTDCRMGLTIFAQSLGLHHA